MITVPAALTPEEKETKQVFEQIKAERKRFEAALKKCGYSSSGKVDQRRPKDSIDDAEQNREEVLKKVAAGKIVIEKADEKQNFKRNRVVRKESNKDEKRDFNKLDPLSSNLGEFKPAANTMANRGPTVYVRGYNLRENTLNSKFSVFGQIKRCYVEERQRSAFITFSIMEEAEEAIRKMNGELIDGISIQVSFARRQNQESWNNQPRWQLQSFGGFASTSKSRVPERQTVKRKLSDTDKGNGGDRPIVSYEEGELFDGD